MYAAVHCWMFPLAMLSRESWNVLAIMVVVGANPFVPEDQDNYYSFPAFFTFSPQKAHFPQPETPFLFPQMTFQSLGPGTS